MDAEAIAVDAANVGLTLIGMAFPEAIPLIAVAKAAIPAVIAAKPYIEQAIRDGESAFAAAEAASPDLGAKIKALASKVPSRIGATADVHLENVTRGLIGFGRMTPEQEMKWMDDATPNHDSTFGG